MRTPTIMTSLALLLSPGSCVANRVNLVDSGVVTVERNRSRHLSFPYVRIYQEDEEVVVSGSIKRSRQYRMPVRGVVTVQIVTPSGEVLEKVETPYSPRSIPIKGARRSRFRTGLTMIPPQGSIVRVSHHAFRKAAAD